jgi:hypothetical protein
MLEMQLDHLLEKIERNPGYIPKVCANVSQVVFPLPPSFTAPSYYKTEERSILPKRVRLLSASSKRGARIF